MTTVSNSVRVRTQEENRRRYMKWARYTLTYAVMTFFAFIFLFPLLWMFMSSFKPDAQIFTDLRSFRAFLPVGDVSLDNYELMLERSNFWLFFKNTLIIAFFSVGLGIIVNSMAAYALARLRWKGRNTILAIIIATLIIPGQTIMIPLLFIVSELPWLDVHALEMIGIRPDLREVLEYGWFNSFHVQIIPGLASAFNIFLFYQFFIDLPMDLDEAARVDGASSFRIYWNIILPISRPVIATVAILSFIAAWNSYLWPLMVTQSQSVRPIMPAIENFFGRTPEWGQSMAFASLVTLPMLVVFFLFQRWFIQSIANAGIKG